jgi:hypothetical protein
VIQIQILSGKMAGATSVARRFPFRVGRSRSADFQIEEPGVWDDHLKFSRGPDNSIELTAQPGALVHLNDQPVTTSRVRNGDLIEIGGVRLVVGLSPTRHKPLRIREGLVWIGLGLIGLFEVGLIYWLLDIN